MRLPWSVRLIGVPFDGMGRNPGQAGAPLALRAAGLEAAFAGRDIVSSPNMTLPEPQAERAPESGLLNGLALATMIRTLRAGLTASISGGELPIVYGADFPFSWQLCRCLREAAGQAGLLFIDGHEDATPMDRSPDGEAANMEIAILLGMTGERLPEPMRESVGALQPDALVMLGPHDQAWRRGLGVGSVAGRVALLNSDEVAANPARAASEAVRRISAHASGWWLHTDLDVLDGRDFSARGAPGKSRCLEG